MAYVWLLDVYVWQPFVLLDDKGQGILLLINGLTKRRCWIWRFKDGIPGMSSGR